MIVQQHILGNLTTFIIEIALKVAVVYHWVPSWKTDYLAGTR